MSVAWRMATTRLTFEASLRGSASNSPGQGASPGAAIRYSLLPLAAGANLTLYPEMLAFPREYIQRATVIYKTGTVAAAVGITATTWRGLGGWIINGAGVDPGVDAGYVPNAGATAIRENDTLESDYREALVFSGAAAAAISSLAGVGTADVILEVSRSKYPYASSDVWLDLFMDDTLDSPPDVATVTARAMLKLKAAGGGLLTLAELGATKIQIPGAAAAFTWRNPIVLTGDWGNGFGQIPADTTLFTAATFAPHPRAFLRSADAVTQLRLIDPIEADNITDAPPVSGDLACVPFTAVSRPTHSVWRFCIKGNTCDVILSHGPTLDARRPRDIWRSIIVPAIAKGSTPTLIYDYRYDTGVKEFFTCGQLEQLEYLDYALCLDLLSSGDNPVLQLTPLA